MSRIEHSKESAVDSTIVSNKTNLFSLENRINP